LSGISLGQLCAVAVILIFSCVSSALEIEPLWVADLDMIMEGAPIVVDLDGDGGDEVITAAYQAIIAVDGSGNERWRFDTAGRYSTCPAVLERDGEVPLIYAGDNKGLFTCLDGAGGIVWQTEIGAVFGPAPGIADISGDGSFEMIQGNQAGVVTAMDALTGDVRWTCQLDGNCSSPAIADLDGDGILEIVIATGTGHVYGINAAGDRMWQTQAGGAAPEWSIPSPVVFENSTGETRIAAASFQGQFFCLDPRGAIVWERPLRGPIASTISVGDLNADGIADLFVVTGTGVLYRFDEHGHTLWEIDTQGRSLAPGAILDLDGDGVREYVLSTQQGNLLTFNNDGEIVYDHQFDNRTINMTVAFGDIVPQRPGAEFAVTGGESGRIFCFGLSAPVDQTAPWRTYRGDNRLSGAWLGLRAPGVAGMIPENLAWDQIVTGEDIAFRVENPNPGEAPLRAQVSCVRPDGSRQVAIGKVVGPSGILKLPLTANAPGAYRFEWTLEDASGVRLVTGSRDVTLEPYRNDRALAARAVLKLREPVDAAAGQKQSGGFAGALVREAQALDDEAARLAVLQAAAPGALPEFLSELGSHTAALNARAKRALRLAQFAPSTLASNPMPSVIAFEGTTWENRDVDRDLPAAVVPLTVSRRSVPGEHEPVSIKLLNVTNETVAVRARVTRAPDGPAVALSEVKPVPTNQGVIAWDPIVPLGEGAISIPPLVTREVWVDVDLSGVKPGTHQLSVLFKTGGVETAAEISLDVLPFSMADSSAMWLCAWASYNDDAVRDLLAHGNNVFIPGLPPATVEEGDPPRITVDFEALDTFVARLNGHDVYLLMGGIPSLGVPMESGDYVPRLADYLEQLMAHLETKGIPEDRIALYPHDEPGGHGWDTVNHYIEFARQGLKARPGLQFYVNGGGDLAMFEAFNEVASIWCPSFYALSEGSAEAEFIKSTGKTVWSYDCAYLFARPIGANTKTINVVAQYRMAAIQGFRDGATGIGYWCYNVGDSIWEPVEFEYPLVYVNPDGSHTSSRRWEAVREGMEDTRILIALRDKLADESVPEETKEAIRHLLDVTVANYTQQALDEARLGVARYVIDASNTDETVAQIRNEMLDCVERLSVQ
jgi:outer membrane protein assembly factor BamB